MHIPLSDGKQHIHLPEAGIVADSSADGKEYVVRCDDPKCRTRLFDISGEGHVLGSPHDPNNSAWHLGAFIIERACRICGRKSKRQIYRERGGGKAKAGRWVCACGAFLAELKPVKGRLILKCRCKREVRVCIYDIDEAMNPPADGQAPSPTAA